MFKKLLTKRNIFVAIAAIAILFVVFRNLSAYSQQPKYQTAEVKKTSIAQEVIASGQIESEDEVELKFPLSGKLTYLAVGKNDKVAKGGYIGSLDQQDLQKRIEKSLYDYSKERNDFDEDQRVTYKGTQNPNEALTDTVKRILEKNQWDLNKAVLDVELADIARKNANLYSPIAGIVTKVQTHEGTSVLAATTPIVTIADPEKLVFVAKVGEADVAEMSEGQEAMLTLDAFEGKKFKGKVKEVDFAATISATGGKTYQVKITLDEIDKVKLYMSGDVKITTISHANALVLPKTVIQGQNGKKYVEVAEGKGTKKKEVTTGIKGTGGTIEVLSGLSQGEKVIIPQPNK